MPAIELYKNMLLDFRNELPTLPSNFQKDTLQLILWAGDGIHDGVTDVERLYNFDVYLCGGYSQALDANVDSLRQRVTPAIICLLDIKNEYQMASFLSLFRNRFSLIDSDYNGNTPTLPIEHYKALLSIGGRAYNIKGINGCILPVEDFQNTLELFAPMLSTEDEYRRKWCDSMIQLAHGNEISPHAAWTSQDFKNPYYDIVRTAQENLNRWNKDRNPVGHRSYMYSRDNIEEYWSLLPEHILTVRMERTSMYYDILQGYITLTMERYRSFLLTLVDPFIANKSEFSSYIRNEPLSKVQEIYGLCKEFQGLQFGTYHDMRRNTDTYGHWISFD